jgi:flagellar hook-basal body complex protein FliE
MNTSIQSIAAVGLDGILKQNEENASSTSQLGMFGSIFQDAIQNVKDTDADLVQAEYLLTTGQLDNPATVTIAATKNQLAVELLVQLRNKALDAYSQLTQISL